MGFLHGKKLHMKVSPWSSYENQPCGSVVLLSGNQAMQTYRMTLMRPLCYRQHGAWSIRGVGATDILSVTLSETRHFS